ncbi:MAG: asparagine synthase (glutamine-hydrolyzing) [Planctomycetes bacterium]|nr:asparagine synthase (glutamine-hydrolyzing) [Planctomycetota bacterium]
MCGIAGYLGKMNIDRDTIDRCLRLMHHRGPDASGFYQHVASNGRRVYLLHTRLSIIDLDERANQPMRYGSHVLIFNGELYNYREICRDRGWMNGRLRTRSDTEVLLHVLARDGWHGLDDCEGMWALALYDERDGSLLLSRDRFGEKPLYLYHTDDGIYFGSEIKFIRELLGRRLEINYEHLYRYMVNGYKALHKNGVAFFRHVVELRPGSVVLISDDGAPRQHIYWKPKHERDVGISYDDIISQVREALVRCVELRLRADVPVAFLMSGGVDSNVLISVAKNVLDYDVHGFTIINDDDRYDERALVDHVVRTLSLRHTAIPADTTTFLDRLRSLIGRHDSPVYTITYYAQWLLIQSIAEHGYRISISGTGADELFSGYYDHHNAYLYEVRHDPELYSASLAAWNAHIKPVVRNPHLSDPDLFIKSPQFRDHIFLDAEVFADFLCQPMAEPFQEERYCDDLLRNRMLNEMFQEAVPPILHEDDLNAMSESIENRSPFLDRELFEICQRIPTRYLIRDGFAKSILRDSMRGIVPDRILDRRQKVGFNAPIASFLDLKDPNVREAVLDDGPIYQHVKREAIETLLDEAFLPNSRSKYLFYFLSAKMFLEEFAA